MVDNVTKHIRVNQMKTVKQEEEQAHYMMYNRFLMLLHYGIDWKVSRPSKVSRQQYIRGG